MLLREVIQPLGERDPKPKPKKRAIGHEETSTWSGKASDVRKPTVKRKKIYSN